MPDIRPTANSSALVLNATYEPLGVVSVRRATILVLSAKAVCLADGDGILHSERATLPVPLVVRLTRFVRVPYRPYVGLSRRAIFARDGGRCAYCRGPAETIDHVMPRSRGGGHLWENVVAACARCNHTKGDKHASRTRLASACRPRRTRGRPGGCSATAHPTRAGPSGSTSPPDRPLPLSMHGPLHARLQRRCRPDGSGGRAKTITLSA